MDGVSDSVSVAPSAEPLAGAVNPGFSAELGQKPEAP